MNNNYYHGNPQGGTGIKKEHHNLWQAIGILRPRSNNENEPLKFIQWKSGGGVINAKLNITEQFGTDEHGNPKTKRTSMPVRIKTNKNITAQQLQSIVSGTKVRVVARMEQETYDSKLDNSKKEIVFADVFVLEILEVPMMPVYGGYPGTAAPVPPQGVPHQYGYPPAPNGYPQYPGYPPQGQPQYQPPYQSQAPQGQPAPSYHGFPPPPPQGQDMPKYYPQHQDMNIDDLPPA